MLLATLRFASYDERKGKNKDKHQETNAKPVWLDIWKWLEE